MPLHPLGCAVQAFNDTITRKSWEENSKDGWYIGTSNKHYRTYDVWIKQTKAKQNTDTVFFQQKYITKPTVTKADVVTEAATKLIAAVKGNFAEVYNDTEMEALQRLAKVFDDATRKMSNAELESPASAPRVAETSPRVEEANIQQNDITSPRVPVYGKPTEIPNLIPADDDTSDSSNSEDEEEDADEYKEEEPRYKTRSQTKNYRHFEGNVTKDSILSACEMTFENLKPAQLAKRQFPLKVLCDIAAAVLDEETGDLLEYRQLLRHSKYRKMWSISFGNEI